MNTDVKKMEIEDAAKAYAETVCEFSFGNKYEEMQLAYDAYLSGFEAGAAQREGEWVYCSDRMPETSESVTIAFIYNDIEGEKSNKIGQAAFKNGLWWDEFYDEGYETEDCTIYAWRPIQPITPPPIK